MKRIIPQPSGPPTDLMELVYSHREDPFAAAALSFIHFTKEYKLPPPSWTTNKRIQELAKLGKRIERVSSKKASKSLTISDARLIRAFFVLNASTLLAKILIDVMINIIQDLEPHLSYWQRFQRNPLSLKNRFLIYHFIQPTYLGEKTTLDVMMDSNCSFLRSLRAQLISQSGRFLRWFWAMEVIDQFPENHEGEHFEAFLRETCSLFAQDRKKTFPSRFNSEQLVEILVNTVQLSQTFFDGIVRSLEEAKSPRHIARHGVVYGAGLIATLIGAGVAYKFRDAVVSTVVNSAVNFRTYLRDSIEGPFFRVTSHIFGKIDRGGDSNMDELRLEKNILHEMIGDLLGEVPKDDCSERLCMDQVMQKYAEESKSPMRNSSSLMQSALVQMQKLKVTGLETKGLMDRMLDANEVNFAVASTVPAVTMLWLGYHGLNRVVFGRRVTLKRYRYKFRQLILRLHTLISELESNNSEIVDETVGRCCLACRELRNLSWQGVAAGLHDIGDYYLLSQDIELFLGKQFSPDQRLRFLSRIEKFYF